MGPAEPEQHTVSVASGQAVTQNFVVQPAVWADDFQSYTNSAQVIAGCTASGQVPPTGTFFAGSGHLLFCSNQQQIALDATGGPNGTQAVRYDWPARAGTGCGSNYAIRLTPTWTPPARFDTLWVRFTTKESVGFVNGLPECDLSGAGGTAYKWLLLDMGPTNSGGGNGRFGAYLFSGSTMYTDMWDGTNYFTLTRVFRLPTVSFPGQYHTYVAQMFNFGTSTATYRLYFDGALISELVGPWFPGRADAGVLSSIDLGATINNGPALPQSRWISDIGIYRSRPWMGSP
jgi:hypothetical protein